MAKQQLKARDSDYAPSPEPRRPQHRAPRLSMHTPELSAPSPIPTPAQKARRPSFPSPRVSHTPCHPWPRSQSTCVASRAGHLPHGRLVCSRWCLMPKS